MIPLPEMTIRLTDRLEKEETMHLFNTEAREGMALCGAAASVRDLITAQDCLKQRIDGIPVRNICQRRCCLSCRCIRDPVYGGEA